MEGLHSILLNQAVRASAACHGRFKSSRIAERRRRLRWSLQAKHALVTSIDGEPVGCLRASFARSAAARLELRKWFRVIWFP